MIKKIFLCFLMVLLLTSCSNGKDVDAGAMERYNSMIEQLSTRADFKTKSEYFDISLDVGSIDGAYRFYVTPEMLMPLTKPLEAFV